MTKCKKGKETREQNGSSIEAKGILFLLTQNQFIHLSKKRKHSLERIKYKIDQNVLANLSLQVRWTINSIPIKPCYFGHILANWQRTRDLTPCCFLQFLQLFCPKTPPPFAGQIFALYFNCRDDNLWWNFHRIMGIM